MGRNSSKKVLEMLVECSLKKFSIIYIVGVPEDETMWDNMDIDDSELRRDPEELDPE